MTIASEITRINTNIANAYDSIEDKGGTIPASPNSANLADAIDSIPSGGSTSNYMDLNESDFNAMITDLDTTISDSDSSTKTSQNIWTDCSLSTHGWVDNGISTDGYQRYITVLSFSTRANTVYLKDNLNILAYKLSSNMTLVRDTSVSSTYPWVLTFTGDERTISIVSADMLRQTDLYQIATSDLTTYTNGRGIIRGIYNKQYFNSIHYWNSYTSSRLYQINDSISYHYKKGMKIIFPSNDKIDVTGLALISNPDISSATVQTTSAGNNLTELVRNLVLTGTTIDTLLTMVKETVTSDGFIEIPTTFTNSAGANLTNVHDCIPYCFGSSVSSDDYDVCRACALLGLDKVPFVIDMSEVTSTSTWYFMSANDLVSLRNSTWITKARIKLSSTRSHSLTQRYGECRFDLASMQYLATNAPTISDSYSIAVGYYILGLMSQTGTAWAQVKSDLEAKGWTIVTSL